MILTLVGAITLLAVGAFLFWLVNEDGLSGQTLAIERTAVSGDPLILDRNEVETRVSALATALDVAAREQRAWIGPQDDVRATRSFLDSVAPRITGREFSEEPTNSNVLWEGNQFRVVLETS